MNMHARELCVFVLGRDQAWGAWKERIQETWATDQTVFVDFGSPKTAEPESEELLERVPTCSNCTPTPSSPSVRRLHLPDRTELPERPYSRGLSLWTALRQKLLDHSNTSSWLDSCYWLMHVDGGAYVNVKRVAQRLSCVKGLHPEYYALGPMIGQARVALADEATGYILSRRLLLSLRSDWVPKCADYLSSSSDAHGFGWNWPSGFYVTLCLWQQLRLLLQRLGDPEQEVLMQAVPAQRLNSPLQRLRNLHPSGHCVLVVAAKTPASLLEIHRRVRLVGPLEGRGRDIVRNEIGCSVALSILEPMALAPPWSYRVARSIARCPLKEAVSETGLGLSLLRRELLEPSRPQGPAVEKLRSARGRKLCILMPTTDASPKQINRAVAAAETWAKPYLPQNSPDARQESPVLALLYSRRPLFPEWANATLSLRGDVDLRHPKFNALRFIYMWLTLALYHWSDCMFFMKADTDAYVNVPRLWATLRAVNASARIYAGQVTLAHGPAYVKWTEFAHGLGYVLSRAALRSAVPGLRFCMNQLLDVRLESIEDMLLGACLRRAEIYPVELGKIIFDFKMTSEHVDGVVKEALVTHRVEAQDMYVLHDAAVRISRWWRGTLGRRRLPAQLRKARLLRCSCERIQRAWRSRRKAREVLDGSFGDVLGDALAFRATVEKPVKKEPCCEVPKASKVQAVQAPEPETRKAGKDSERSAIDAVLAEFAVYTGAEPQSRAAALWQGCKLRRALATRAVQAKLQLRRDLYWLIVDVESRHPPQVQVQDPHVGPWLDVLYAGLSKLQSEALAELAAALHGRRLPLGRPTFRGWPKDLRRLPRLVTRPRPPIEVGESAREPEADTHGHAEPRRCPPGRRTPPKDWSKVAPKVRCWDKGQPLPVAGAVSAGYQSGASTPTGRRPLSCSRAGSPQGPPTQALLRQRPRPGHLTKVAMSIETSASKRS
ncbi:Chsy3 [Symbiodinium sp. CCMP2456]|nr:Chsy3 [Symbiodinium sp. CCMP2456]